MVFFPVIAEEMTNKMAEEDCGLCMLRYLRDDLSDFSVVDRFSIVTFDRIGSLPLLIFARCKHSKQSTYSSHDDFMILLTLI